MATWLFVPESPVRSPGRVNWLGAVLLSGWLVCLLVGLSEAPTWGWGSPRVLGLFALAVVLLARLDPCRVPRSSEPLVDMKMMRLRGVWTVNLAAVLIGFGMYNSFLLIPQFVELPTSTGFGFGASVTQAGLFLLPSTIAMLIVEPDRRPLAGRIGSRIPLIVGAAFSALAFVLLTVAHSERWQIYVASTLLGIGIGLAFASMSNLIVEAVPPRADRHRDRHEHDHAHGRRRARHDDRRQRDRRQPRLERPAARERLRDRVRALGRSPSWWASWPRCSCRARLRGAAHAGRRRARAPMLADDAV